MTKGNSEEGVKNYRKDNIPAVHSEEELPNCTAGNECL